MRRLMRGWLMLSLSLLLAACASGPAPIPPSALFADGRFAPPSEPVGADALFARSPARHHRKYSRRDVECARPHASQG